MGLSTICSLLFLVYCTLLSLATLWALRQRAKIQANNPIPKQQNEQNKKLERKLWRFAFLTCLGHMLIALMMVIIKLLIFIKFPKKRLEFIWPQSRKMYFWSLCSTANIPWCWTRARWFCRVGWCFGPVPASGENYSLISCQKGCTKKLWVSKWRRWRRRGRPKLLSSHRHATAEKK